MLCYRHGVTHTDRESDRCCGTSTRCAEESSTESERLPAHHPLYLLADPQVTTNTCLSVSAENHGSGVHALCFMLLSSLMGSLLVWVSLCSILS